jgi:hypothetical protein
MRAGYPPLFACAPELPLRVQVVPAVRVEQSGTAMRFLNFVLVASVLSTMLIAIALVGAAITSVAHGQFASGSHRPSVVQN